MAKSGVSVVGPEAWIRICKVSGTNNMREVPNVKIETPKTIGIHGDRAIKTEAKEGAKTAADIEQQPASKNAFNLHSCQPRRNTIREKACLRSS